MPPAFSGWHGVGLRSPSGRHRLAKVGLKLRNQIMSLCLRDAETAGALSAIPEFDDRVERRDRGPAQEQERLVFASRKFRDLVHVGTTARCWFVQPSDGRGLEATV